MIINETWDWILHQEFKKPYIQRIMEHLRKDATVLQPKPADIWNGLRATSFDNTRVVILGQDPYYSGYANGLAFSTDDTMTPSLKVIFKELTKEFGVKRESPNLADWAQQGVLLLNTVLTTKYGQPNAHKGIGWELFTGFILQCLAKRQSPTVFMIWGKDAKLTAERWIFPYLNGNRHLVLKAMHPAAEAYGDGTYTFTGCDHFRKANDFLGDNKRGRIKWV